MSKDVIQGVGELAQAGAGAVDENPRLALRALLVIIIVLLVGKVWWDVNSSNQINGRLDSIDKELSKIGADLKAHVATPYHHGAMSKDRIEAMAEDVGELKSDMKSLRALVIELARGKGG